MDGNSFEPLARFFQLLGGAPLPSRADRSAGGLLPTRAFRYCEAVTAASALGWYAFPPIGFSLMWDGVQVGWTFDGAEEWYLLERAQFPGFSAQFDIEAPDAVRGFAPPFLAALPEPGVVQIWSGLLARTRPNWSLLLRAPANLPRPAGYDLYEGIVETDRWFGPLFTNVRLLKTDVPVRFNPEMPLFQMQPLQRASYSDELLNQFSVASGIDTLSTGDWADYQATVVRPGPATARPLGQDAALVRRRRRREITQRPQG